MQQAIWSFGLLLISLLLFLFGIYSIFAGYDIYRNDSFPSYFNEPRAKLGKPRNMAIGIVIRGIFSILFSSLILYNFFR